MKHFKVLSSLISIFIVLVEVLLGTRFILKAFGANELSQFVQWVNLTSKSFLGPFSNIFPSPAVGSGYIVELSTIFAMFIYAVFGYICEEIITHFENIFTKRNTIKNPELPPTQAS